MSQNNDEAEDAGTSARATKGTRGSQSPEDRDYEIGYGKPPKATQFKRGTSGNAKGRKKRPPTVFEQIQELLAQRVTVTVDGKRKSLSALEIMLKSIANAGMKGDLKAVSFLLQLQSSHRDSAATSINSRKLDGEAQNLLDDYIKQFQIGEPIPVSPHNDLSNPVAKTDTSEVRACGPAEHPAGIIVTPNSADPTPKAPKVTAAHTDGAPNNVPSEAASGDTPQAEKGTSSTPEASPLATAWPEPSRRSDGKQ